MSRRTRRKAPSASIVAGPEDADGYRWYRIMTSERFAWVASTFLTWSDQPAPDRPVPTTELEVGDTVAVADGPLQMHRTPGLGDDVIGTVETGAVGVLTNGPEIADDQVWFEMRTASFTGWVAAPYLELQPTPAPRRPLRSGMPSTSRTVRSICARSPTMAPPFSPSCKLAITARSPMGR